jgi:hypothetical protein
MLRILTLIIATFVLTGTSLVSVSVAQTQSAPTKGGWTIEKCMAVCQSKRGKNSARYCARKRLLH